MGDLVDTLILLGVLQGVGLMIVLARRRADHLANQLLAALVGAVAAMLLFGYLEVRWGFHGHPHLIGLGIPLPFLFGPLLYLYVIALTRPIERFDARWFVHALPFVADVIYLMQAFYLLGADDKLATVQAYIAGHTSASKYMLDALELVQAMSYLVASWLALRRYARKMQGYFSDLTRIDLRWLSAIVLGNVAVWSIVLVSEVVRLAGHQDGFVDGLQRAVQLGSALVLFLIGYVSLWQPELLQKARAARVAELESTLESTPAHTQRHLELVAAPAPPAPPDAPNDGSSSQPKYQRNRLDDAEAAALAQRLVALMTEKRMYRDSALTLQVLADALDTTAHVLSQILNTRIGKSFYVFVNAYRVEAVQLALADPTARERGVLEIAFEAGFNSKSTLNSFFKRQTGMTPSEYRKQAIEHAAQARSAS